MIYSRSPSRPTAAWTGGHGITSIDVAASITGATWFVKGKGDALKNVRFEVDTTRERLTMDFVGQDKRSIFEPSRAVTGPSEGYPRA